jgi:hypothetical protein
MLKVVRWVDEDVIADDTLCVLDDVIDLDEGNLP